MDSTVWFVLARILDNIVSTAWSIYNATAIFKFIEQRPVLPFGCCAVVICL